MASGRAQLQRLIADFGAIRDEVKREIRPAIREGAKPMLQGMKRSASWSTRIPPATRISTSFSGRGAGAGVSIVVNASKAPHARVYENDGNPGTFRAPLWGDRDHWFNHRARPFFAPAIRKYGPEVVEAVAERISEITARHGF
jgi:hypothetical protein